LKGGGPEVGRWATEHGFRLPPAAPEVLDFYANRSPIFLAAVFDADAAKARGQRIGDGTPVHVTIPTANPWVPLRILGLGKNADDRIDADVYLLTDQRPALLPYPLGNGMRLDHSAVATTSLLDDLRSDKGMDWVPQAGWLSKIAIDASASQLTYDLAVDAKGSSPSRVAAGLQAPAGQTGSSTGGPANDPIDHEWLIGDEAFHARHRAGTEAVHGDRPKEISLPPFSVRTTTLTFDKPGPLTFICHFPQHEAYGMVGVVMVKP